MVETSTGKNGAMMESARTMIKWIMKTVPKISSVLFGVVSFSGPLTLQIDVRAISYGKTPLYVFMEESVTAKSPLELMLAAVRLTAAYK